MTAEEAEGGGGCHGRGRTRSWMRWRRLLSEENSWRSVKVSEALTSGDGVGGTR